MTIYAIGWGILGFVVVFIHNPLGAFLLWLIAMVVTGLIAIVVGLTTAAEIKQSSAAAMPAGDSPGRHWLLVGWVAVPVCTLGLAALALVGGPLEGVQETVIC